MADKINNAALVTNKAVTVPKPVLKPLPPRIAIIPRPAPVKPTANPVPPSSPPAAKMEITEESAHPARSFSVESVKENKENNDIPVIVMVLLAAAWYVISMGIIL